MSETLKKQSKHLPGKIKTLIPWAGLFVTLYFMGFFLPEGFDWVIFFSKGVFPPPWMPWTQVVMRFLNLPAVFAITVMSIGIRSFRYNRSPLPVLLALVSLPTLWVFFMGNLDGLALLGILLLPWGAPLVLLKPQIASFSLLANRRSLLAGVIWILISLMIWGFWPLNLLMVQTPEWKAEWVQDISLFPWGLIIAIPLLWLSRGDEDLLMAAGSFATPHLFPYHFIILMPALARMNKLWMIITWMVSWTPLLANYLGPGAWHFGNLLGGCFWCGIYFTNKGKLLHNDQDRQELTGALNAGVPPNLETGAHESQASK